MTRGIESPRRFVLLVEWDSVDAHVRQLPRHRPLHARGARLIGPYFDGAPTVEHFTDVPA